MLREFDFDSYTPGEAGGDDGGPGGVWLDETLRMDGVDGREVSEVSQVQADLDDIGEGRSPPMDSG